MIAPRWLLVGAGGLLAAAALSSSARASYAPGGASFDDGRPILIIGDSYAVGIAAALKKLYPGRDVRSVAVGGTSSAQMQIAPDAHVFVIVSAGTNDVGISAPTQQTVSGILRVLGPYAAQTATQGRLFYVLPGVDMSDDWATLRGRVKILRAMLEARLHESERFKFGAPAIVPAESGDGLHFDGPGYESIARQAMHALAPGGLQVEPPNSGSKSGLLPNGEIDPVFQARARQIAERRGIPLEMLLAIMDFETGGTFKSDIQNPQSHATGLIQFMPKLNGATVYYEPGHKTAAELGQMSAVGQLDFVERYFERFGSFAGKPPSDAYLAVFSPSMRGLPDAHKFYQEGSIQYTQNAGLDTNKDGAIDVGEVRRIINRSLAKVRAKGWAT